MISYAKPTMFFSMPEQIVKEFDKVGNSQLISESDSDEFDAESLIPNPYKVKEKLYFLFAEDMEELAKVLKKVQDEVTSDK